MEGLEQAPFFIKWIAEIGFFQFLKEHFTVNQQLFIIFGGMGIILLFLIITIIAIINFVLMKFNKNNINKKSILGNSIEEKFENIMRIKKIHKYIKLFFLCGEIVVLLVILFSKGVSGSFIDKLFDIDLWLLLISCYIYNVYIFGNGLAWFLFMKSNDIYELPETTDYEDYKQKIIDAYIIGGRRYANSVAIGIGAGDIFTIIIGIAFGYFIGWYNAIKNHGEVLLIQKEFKKQCNLVKSKKK